MKAAEGVFPEPEFPHVYIGGDTRASTPALVDAVRTALESLRVLYTDFGQITTPMLHYLVANHKLSPTPTSYVERLANCFLEFMNLITADHRKYERRMTVDCANGAAAIHMADLAPRIAEHIKIDLINTKTT